MSQIQKGKFPQSFNTEILLRSYSEKELEEIYARYRDGLTRFGGRYQPTEQHIALYSDWLNNRKSLAQIAQEMAVSGQGTVMNRFCAIGRKAVLGEIKVK